MPLSSGFVQAQVVVGCRGLRGKGPTTGTGDGKALEQETEQLQTQMKDLDLYLQAKDAEAAELEQLWAEHDAFAVQMEEVDGEVADAEVKLQEMNKWMAGCENIVENAKVCLEKYWKLVAAVEAADAKDLQYLESVELKLKEDPRAFFKEIGVDDPVEEKEEEDKTQGFPYGTWFDLSCMEKMENSVSDENLQDTCDAVKDFAPVWEVLQCKPVICFRKQKYSCTINVPLHKEHDSLKLTGVGNSHVEAYDDAMRQLLAAILPSDVL